MDWSFFHIGTAFALALYTVIDDWRTFKVNPLIGRQHVLGAEVLFFSALLSWVSREVTQDEAPLAFYAGIDVVAVTIFAWIMARKQAAWAALCVLFHAAMLALHLYVFESGSKDASFFRWVLGALQFASVLTVLAATLIGRHDRFARLDDINLNMAGLRIRSWSGVRNKGLASSGGTVA